MGDCCGHSRHRLPPDRNRAGGARDVCGKGRAWRTFANERCYRWFTALPAPQASQCLVTAGLTAGHAAGLARRPSFTAEQVERGRTAYNQNCQECHGSTLDNGEFGGPPLKGTYFRNHWGAGSVADLTGYAKSLMPPDRPGRLSGQTYTDVVAFLLSNNGYAPNGRELPTDVAAQEKMSLKK